MSDKTIKISVSNNVRRRHLRFGVTLAAFALTTIMAAGNAQATCNLASSVTGLFAGGGGLGNVSNPNSNNPYANLTSTTVNICGYNISVSTQYTYNQAIFMNNVTFMANGHTVNITTPAPNFDSIIGGGSNGQVYHNANITVMVDGKTIYTGPVRSASIQNGLDLLALLGISDTGSIVQQAVSRAETRLTANLIANRISTIVTAGVGGTQMRDRGKPRDKDKGTGASGGESGNDFGLWATPANTWLADTGDFTTSRGTLQNAVFGGDYKINPMFTIGLALGLEHTNMSTTYNSGGMDSQGLSATPYVAMSMFDQAVVWSMMGGGALSVSDSVRRAGATRITGHSLANRYMYGSDITGYIPLGDDWMISPVTGILVAWDHRRGFTESDGTRPLKNDSALLEGKLGTKVTYSFSNYSVFAGATYLYDFFQDQDITDPNKNYDRTELLGSVGFNWFPDENQSLGFQADNSFTRSNTRQTTILGNYRYTF